MYKSRENVVLYDVFLMGILLAWEDPLNLLFFTKLIFCQSTKLLKANLILKQKYYLTDTFSVDSDAFLQAVIYFSF